MQINVKVFPKSKLNKIKEISINHYNIHTTAAPNKNKANQSIIKILSKKLNIPKSKINIIKGSKNKNKIINIQN